MERILIVFGWATEAFDILSHEVQPVFFAFYFLEVRSQFYIPSFWSFLILVSANNVYIILPKFLQYSRRIS